MSLSFAVKSLPTSGVQFRHVSGGTGTAPATAYVQACRALATWSKGSADNSALVHALVHLGWHSGTGSRANVRASNSAAWKHAAPVLTVGKPAASQVVTTLKALVAAGAPAEQVAIVWATFTGA